MFKINIKNDSCFRKYALMLKKRTLQIFRTLKSKRFFMTETCHQKDADFYTLVLIKETKKYLMTKFS